MNKKFKLTPQRLAIIEFLKDNTAHPSAEDIYREISKKFPTISFSTVYNTLENLKKIGKINELHIDPSKKRFDPNPAPHHHLICIQCKKIIDIYGEYKLLVDEVNSQGFEIIGNHIEFYGTCPECKNKTQK